jgi:hypothetical protein
MRRLDARTLEWHSILRVLASLVSLKLSLDKVYSKTHLWGLIVLVYIDKLPHLG